MLQSTNTTQISSSLCLDIFYVNLIILLLTYYLWCFRRDGYTLTSHDENNLQELFQKIRDILLDIRENLYRLFNSVQGENLSNIQDQTIDLITNNIGQLRTDFESLLEHMESYRSWGFLEETEIWQVIEGTSNLLNDIISWSNSVVFTLIT